MDRDKHLSAEFHIDEDNDVVYVTFLENRKTAGIIALSEGGWENLKARLLEWSPVNGYMTLENV